MNPQLSLPFCTNEVMLSDMPSCSDVWALCHSICCRHDIGSLSTLRVSFRDLFNKQFVARNGMNAQCVGYALYGDSHDGLQQLYQIRSYCYPFCARLICNARPRYLTLGTSWIYRPRLSSPIFGVALRIILAQSQTSKIGELERGM